MNFSDYASSLQEKVTQRERSGQYDQTFKTYPSPFADDMAELEAEIAQEDGMENFTIGDSLKQFYLATERPHLAWQYLGHPDKSRIITGVLRINSFYAIYDPDDEIGQPFNLLYQKYRLFDWIGTEEQVVLKFHQSRCEPELYYYAKETDTYHLLSLGVTDYLDIAHKVMGLYPWQKFFIADPAQAINAEEAALFYSAMERLFPEASGVFRGR